METPNLCVNWFKAREGCKNVSIASLPERVSVRQAMDQDGGRLMSWGGVAGQSTYAPFPCHPPRSQLLFSRKVRWFLPERSRFKVQMMCAQEFYRHKNIVFGLYIKTVLCHSPSRIQTSNKIIYSSQLKCNSEYRTIAAVREWM